MTLEKIHHDTSNLNDSPSKPKVVYPFDFNKIKVVIKRPKQEDSETIYLDRKWASQKIPHFTSVIQNVNSSEGIEITLTCNLDAFKFAVAYLEAQEKPEPIYDFMSERVSNSNCLSLMVTCEFLQLRAITQHIIRFKFLPCFVDIINTLASSWASRLSGT